MTQKRVRRSEATWRELFSRQVTSGKAVTAFCRAEGINPGLFRRWRSALGRSRRSRVRVRQAPAMSAQAAPFIELGGLGATNPRFEVRLELGGGLVLSIARS